MKGCICTSVPFIVAVARQFEIFRSMMMLKIGLLQSVLVLFSSRFGIQIIAAIWNELGSFSTCFVLDSNNLIVFFRLINNSSLKPSECGDLVVERHLIITSVFLYIYHIGLLGIMYHSIIYPCSHQIVLDSRVIILVPDSNSYVFLNRSVSILHLLFLCL